MTQAIPSPNDGLTRPHAIKRSGGWIADSNARRAGFDAIREQCDIDIFCGIFSGGDQGGFTLDTPLCRRLADAGLAVAFDIY